MNTQKTDTHSSGSNLINWLLGIVFVIIGILNLLLVHPIPASMYLLFSPFYFPPVSILFKQRYGFSIPLIVKYILAFVILWGTLAVGDLAEILGL